MDEEEIIITVSKNEIEIDYTWTDWNSWMLLNSGIVEKVVELFGR